MPRKQVLDKSRNRLDHAEAAKRLRGLGFDVPSKPKTKSEKDRIRRLYNRQSSVVENAEKYVAVKVGKDAKEWREKGAIVHKDRVIVFRGKVTDKNKRVTYSKKNKTINIRGVEQPRKMRLGELPKPKKSAVYGIASARGGQIYTTVLGEDLEAFLARYERDKDFLLVVELPEEESDD